MNRIYYQIIDVTDYGPYVNKLVLSMPRTVCTEEISPSAFNVYVDILDRHGDPVTQPKSFIEKDIFVPSQGYRTITAAYPSDRFGHPMKQSDYITLELACGPIWDCGLAVAPDHTNINGHHAYVIHQYRITQTGPIGTNTKGASLLTGLVFDTCGGVHNPKKDRFLTGCSTDENLPLRYGYYLPKKIQNKRPLILFLHGAGEGGYDLPVVWTANKVTEFTEEDKQAIFGGAAILVPQSPTMWLDDGSHQYGDSGISMYTEAVKSLVDEFIEQHSAMIDTDRIYIGGDSNGGFMTMRMIMSYPDFFAAAFPICEAMPDKRILDQDIQNLKDHPIWFTHSKDDPVVPPENFVLPTYQRLMDAGAANVHFTFWDEIRDIHAGFLDEHGEHYRYLGHFSWIPVYNDDCRLDFDGKPVTVDGREVSLMEWLSLQRLSHRL